MEVRTKKEIHPKVLLTRREPPLPAHPGTKFAMAHQTHSDTLPQGKSTTASSFPLPNLGGTCPLKSCCLSGECGQRDRLQPGGRPPAAGGPGRQGPRRSAATPARRGTGEGPAPLAARPAGARSTRRPLCPVPASPRSFSFQRGPRRPSSPTAETSPNFRPAQRSPLCGSLPAGRGRGPGPAPHGASRAAPPFFPGYQRASPVPLRPLRAAAPPAAGFLRGAGRPPLRNSFLRRSAAAAAAPAPLPGPTVEGRNAEQNRRGRANHNLFLPVARG